MNRDGHAAIDHLASTAVLRALTDLFRFDHDRGANRGKIHIECGEIPQQATSRWTMPFQNA